MTPFVHFGLLWAAPSVRSLGRMTLILPVAMLPSVLGAQPRSAPDSLDLAGALAIARQSSPALRVVEARREIAKGRAGETAQFVNPTVEYRRENLGSPLAPDIFATVYVPFDVTGRRFALRTAAGAATRRADAELVAERRDAELDVARSWLRAAVAQSHLQIARGHVDAMGQLATIDSTRHAEGLVAEGVALRTRLETDRARLAMTTAFSEWSRARAELARALGIDVSVLRAVQALPAPALPALPDSAAAVSLALGARPDVAAREAGVDEARAKLSAETRATLGDWQLQGGSKQTGGYMTGQIGLAVPLPLFNRNGAAQQRARGELAEATAARDATLLGVRAHAVAMWMSYAAVRASVVDARGLAARGRDVASIARAAYREGHITLTELLDAERAAMESLQMHARWTAETWLARFELERALGARLDLDSPLDLPLRTQLRANP
jgi:cobalt-zinc-cadmium efflux system outer membrane protein